jgi:hypothetical protein
MEQKFGEEHKGYIKELNRSHAARTLVLRNNQAKAALARKKAATNRIPTIPTHQNNFQDMLMAVKMQPVMLSEVIREEIASLKSNDQTVSQLDIAERSLGFEPNNNTLHKFTSKPKQISSMTPQE